MTHLAASSLRATLSEALNRVRYAGERIVLERRGKGVAALVSMEDLALLEELENRIDLEAARKALAEMKAKGGKPIPWAKVKRELGIS